MKSKLDQLDAAKRQAEQQKYAAVAEKVNAQKEVHKKDDEIKAMDAKLKSNKILCINKLSFKDNSFDFNELNCCR